MVTHMCIQVFAEERRLYLSCVSVAYSSDDVGISQTALEHVRVVIACLEHVFVEDVFRQIRPVAQCRYVVHALEPQVVYCQDRLGVLDRRIRELCAKQYRHKTCLPVVAVDDVRYPVHVVQSRQCSLAEVAVLRDVVDKIDIRIAARKEIIVIDEVVYYSIPYVLHDAYIK